jgi:hypothetical protein
MPGQIEEKNVAKKSDIWVSRLRRDCVESGRARRMSAGLSRHERRHHLERDGDLMRRRVLTMAFLCLTAGLGSTQSAKACCWGFYTCSPCSPHTKTYTCAPTTYSYCGPTCAPKKAHHHAKPAPSTTPAPPATPPPATTPAPPAPPKTSMAPAAQPRYRQGWYYRPVAVRGR